MKVPSRPDTETLLNAAAHGDLQAPGRLFERHRARLRRMVAVRMDPRIAARVDPSDLVQEALTDAARRLNGYLEDRPIPFYPWLRQFAADRLGMAYRQHVRARRRSVNREEALALPDRSAIALADRLIGSGTEPGDRIDREEQRNRVRLALDTLPDRDREVLILRYLEELSTADTAATLGLSEGAIKMRLLRAIQKLHDHIAREDGQ